MNRCDTTGKRIYRSQEKAEKMLARYILSPNPNHREIRTYRCPFCHLWHLTSQART